MDRTWVVVANAGGARLFATSHPPRPLKEVATLENPAARLHEGELVSDRRGRIGELGRPTDSYQPAQPPKDRLYEDFARRVGERIEIGRRQGEFERLVLIAPPDFLGKLRAQLKGATRRLVVREETRDLYAADEPVLRSYVPAGVEGRPRVYSTRFEHRRGR